MNTQDEQNKLREQLSELTPEQINSMKEELNDIKQAEFPSDAIVSRKRMMKGKMSPLGTYWLVVTVKANSKTTSKYVAYRLMGKIDKLDEAKHVHDLREKIRAKYKF